jgi:hypothetical protein
VTECGEEGELRRPQLGSGARITGREVLSHGRTSYRSAGPNITYSDYDRAMRIADHSASLGLPWEVVTEESGERRAVYRRSPIVTIARAMQNRYEKSWSTSDWIETVDRHCPYPKRSLPYVDIGPLATLSVAFLLGGGGWACGWAFRILVGQL